MRRDARNDISYQFAMPVATATMKDENAALRQAPRRPCHSG